MCCAPERLQLTRAQPEADVGEPTDGPGAVADAEEQLESDMEALNLAPSGAGHFSEGGANGDKGGSERGGGGGDGGRPDNYKTRLCLKWQMSGECLFGSRCFFAHGQHEMQARSFEQRPAAPHQPSYVYHQGGGGGNVGGGGGGGPGYDSGPSHLPRSAVATHSPRDPLCATCPEPYTQHPNA